MSCSDNPTDHKQQGDTCMAPVNNMVGRHVQSGEDASGFGQWIYIKIAGKHQRKIVLITGYRLCVQSDPGDSTVTAQHKQLLTMKGIKNVNPRKQWDKDFLDAVKKWKDGGNKVFFMGDLNGSIEDADISKLLATAEFYDVMRSHHGINSQKPS
eukprot:3327497-Ditylum_brightwellii.AAC.1